MEHIVKERGVFLFNKDTWLLVEVYHRDENTMQGFVENGGWFLKYDFKKKILECCDEYMGEPVSFYKTELTWEYEYDVKYCQDWCDTQLGSYHVRWSDYNEVIMWAQSVYNCSQAL